MGVPAFFRWLTRKYPSVIVHCVEEKSLDVNGVRIPIDSSKPNPNGVEFDNLYLDMNGIIHPCTHPEDRPAPRNEDEMMVAIFECIDRIFNIVRPRKLLYMAIDGVAPRAKMNQQRSRRFRSSKESVEKINEIKRIRAELLLRGAELPDEKPKEEHFDSNCITPGTPFMARLSECLHYYIHERLNSDPGWRDIKVILSDANVPGEGEHKIMDFIRKQRAQPDHDPNTQHCLCGADADLIMLGLATHEPNFTIIREEFKPNKPRPCDICGQLGHEMKDCLGNCAPMEQDTQKITSETDFIFVRLNVLKEYLEKELQMPNLPFKYDFERAVDDWVFMCFFVGNDFLPHLPSLEIREGAIDRLVSLYKDCVYKTGGWLTDSGDVNLERVQLIMKQLGAVEDAIFKARQKKELEFKAREKAKKRRLDGYNQDRPNWDLVRDTQFAPMALGQSRTVVNARQEAYQIRRAGMHTQISNTVKIVNFVKSSESSIDTVDNASVTNTDIVTNNNDDDNRRGVKRRIDDVEPCDKDEEDDDDEDDQAHDEVRLWEAGFKDRYYESKFDVGPNNREFRNQVALHYVRGLCWVLRYYYQGCASWKWYFPYHYAPFASDFVHISGLSTEFEEDTEPFRPLEQLMSVFPAASSKHVPEPWAKLMSDPESPIIDFYPEDFKIDLNGKKFAWQGVALLPFVEEERLFKALEPYYEHLTPEEKQRNIRGDDRLYISMNNQNYNLLRELYTKKVSIIQEVVVTMEGMRGTVLISNECITEGGYLDSPVVGLDPVIDNSVCCVRFRDPQYTKGYIFSSKKLKGASDPPKVLKPTDLDPGANRNWRAQIGMAPATQRASLGIAGHRMLDHGMPRNPSVGVYSNVPPPPRNDNRRYQQHYNRDNSGSNYGSPGGGYNSYNTQQNYHQQNYQQQNYQQQYRNYNSSGYSGNSQWHDRNGGYNQQNYGNYRNNYNSGRSYYQDRDQYRPERTPYHDRNQHQDRNQNQQHQERSQHRMPGPYKDGYVPSTAWRNSQH